MEPPRVSRFQRRPGPNADPRTRRDEVLAFDPSSAWVRPEWFERVAVALFETTDAVNIGGVVRAMANTGFSRLRLVNPAVFDPWDVVGVAHYTQHIVDAAEVHASLDAALADATLVIGLSGKHHRAQRNATPLPQAQALVAEHARAGGLAVLLFGREDRGLPNDALDRCHLVTTIPTDPAYTSLNLAQAALLTLYGLFTLAGGQEQVFRPPQRHAEPASGALLEDLFADLERALEAIDFFGRRSARSTMRTLRAALFRARLDRNEAALLRAVAIEVRRYLHRHGLRSEVGPIGHADDVV